jgi:hypothetical protein
MYLIELNTVINYQVFKPRAGIFGTGQTGDEYKVRRVHKKQASSDTSSSNPVLAAAICGSPDVSLHSSSPQLRVAPLANFVADQQQHQIVAISLQSDRNWLR